VSADTARRIAIELVRHGLGSPARLLLDAHRPLGPLAADAGAALAPLLRVLGQRTSGDLAELLDDEHAMERVIRELDDLEAARAQSS